MWLSCRCLPIHLLNAEFRFGDVTNKAAVNANHPVVVLSMLGLLQFPYNFRINFSISTPQKVPAGILAGIVLNLQIGLEELQLDDAEFSTHG